MNLKLCFYFHQLIHIVMPNFFMGETLFSQFRIVVQRDKIITFYFLKTNSRCSVPFSSITGDQFISTSILQISI